MMNGVIMIYWDTTLSAWQVSLATSTIPLMNTICNFKGQAVGGGVTTSWHDCDNTFYIWSKIGELDFTPDRDNEAGYRRCPYGGEVYNVKRLDDGVIGYSSKGITLLSPVNSPTTTFGFKELSDKGIYNKGAINGSLHRHVCVGKDLLVRDISREGVKELGYNYWMDLLASSGDDIIVSYDKGSDDFYIGNSTRTFLLSPYGLSEVQQHPSTVWRIDPDNVYMLPDTEDDVEMSIITEAIDFEYKGQKTIQTIETDAFLGTSPYAAVDCTFNLSNWRSSNYTPINNMGIATVPMAGNMFRLKLKFDSLSESFRIGYIKTRFKMTDLRGIRGVYAPPLRGQG